MDRQKLARGLVLLIFALSTGIYYTGITSYLTLGELKKHQTVLVQFVAENPYLSPFVFTVTYSLVVSISLPGATLCTLLGNYHH